MRTVTRTRLTVAFLSFAIVNGAAAAASRGMVAPSPTVRLAQQDPADDPGDASAAVIRLGRLEEQIRTMTGQIEELQYQNRKLEENLRKLQADTDFRFQDLQRGAGGAPAPARPTVPPPQRRGETGGGTPDGAGTLADDAPASVPETPRASRGTSDAFDPDANPSAPGAPKPLGTTAPSQPLAPRAARGASVDEMHAPLDLMHPHPPASDAAPDSTPAIIAAPAGAPRDPAVASLAPGGTRDEYDADLGLFKQGQYDGAATGFTAFADKYPKDRLVPDALYLAGESYARLGRQREAAEQFLKVSTDFGKSTRAPDALLRLGVSLNALGAKDQACATYQEVTRRYPTASADVRAGVDRETRRAHCPGNG